MRTQKVYIHKDDTSNTKLKHKSLIPKAIKRQSLKDELLKGTSKRQAVKITGYHPGPKTFREIDIEVQEALHLNGITTERLVDRLNDGLNATTPVYTKDGYAGEREDREHQRWSWEQSAKLLGLIRKDVIDLQVGGSLAKEQIKPILDRIAKLQTGLEIQDAEIVENQDQR